MAQKSEKVNFPPWDRFFDFSFPSNGCFRKKKNCRRIKKSSPSPLWGHCLSHAGWMIQKITYLHSPTSFSLIVFSLTPHSDVESEPRKAILPSSWLIPGLSRNVDPLKLRRYRLWKGLPYLTWVWWRSNAIYEDCWHKDTELLRQLLPPIWNHLLSLKLFLQLMCNKNWIWSWTCGSCCYHLRSCSSISCHKVVSDDCDVAPLIFD